jgi:hypothetical protein
VAKRLQLQVIGDDDDPGSADELGRQLAKDLRAIGGLAVDPVYAERPAMAKSGTVQQIGYWVVSGLLSASTVGAVRDVLVAYLARTRARAVRIKAGDREVTLEGVSAADLASVTEQLRSILDGEETA